MRIKRYGNRHAHGAPYADIILSGCAKASDEVAIFQACKGGTIISNASDLLY